MGYQILAAAVGGAVIAIIWELVKWLSSRKCKNQREVMSGVGAGRKAYYDRYGKNSPVTDEAMCEAISESKINAAAVRAGVLEAERQNRERRRELGITGKEFDKATVDNQVAKFCRIANEYTDVPDSLELEEKWEALQNLMLEPLYKGDYPDQDGIMVAYQNWRECLEALHVLTERPKFAYLVGALEIASQEFLMQICVRAGQGTDAALQDAWVLMLIDLGTQPVAGTIKMPWQTWF